MTRFTTEEIVRQLLDAGTCPRCDRALRDRGWCRSCGAVLGADAAAGMWRVSVAAADALRARQNTIDSLATSWTPDSIVTTPPALVNPVTPTRAERARSQVSVQSILAIAGAGLVAVAAIVFTFLNGDLATSAARTIVLLAATGVFVAVSWTLAARRLILSAESFAWAGALFLALDVWSGAQFTPGNLSELTATGIYALLASSLSMVIGWRTRTRSWIIAGLVGLWGAPLLFGAASHSIQGWAAAFAVSSLVALFSQRLVRMLTRRLTAEPRIERVLLTSLQVAATAVAAALECTVTAAGHPVDAATASFVLLVLAAACAASSRDGLSRVWTFGSGALGATALCVLAFAAPISNSDWILAAVPAAGLAAVALVLVSARWLPGSGRVRAGGAWAVVLISAAPASAFSLLELILFVAGHEQTPQTEQCIVAVSVVAATSLTVGILERIPAARFVGSLAVVIAVLLVPTLGLVAPVGQLAMALGAALVLAAGSRFISSAGARSPLALIFLIGAHGAVLLAVLISVRDYQLQVIGGAVTLAVFAAIARALPKSLWPLPIGTGFAYGLAIFATLMNHMGQHGLVILDQVAAFAGAVLLISTLSRRGAVWTWRTCLVVALVPLTGVVGSMLLQRDGWTALALCVWFALAFIVMRSLRSGIGGRTKAAAAGMLVPLLSAISICVTGQLLTVSAAPVILPAIAVVVAIVLPTTVVIEGALIRGGMPRVDARMVKLALEISALVTGGLAVLVALMRVAAGLSTSLIVLVIVGLGATAAAVFVGRRYAWWVAGFSFVGALWCACAMAGVGFVEPYVIPPGFAAAMVALLAARRGRRSWPLFCAGLAVAILPTLVAIAFPVGEPVQPPVRAVALLISAGGLIVGGITLSRASMRVNLRRLSPPTFAVATLAAAAGSLQGLRYGRGIDVLSVPHGSLIWIVLAYALPSAAIATAAGLAVRSRIAVDFPRAARSRWLLAPAVMLLAVPLVASVHPGWASVWIPFAVSLSLLALMVAGVAATSIGAVVPPMWFTFLVAWVCAVAAWSNRDLRVEAFSVPLGIALIAAGAIPLHRTRDDEAKARSIIAWPVGFSGSWATVAPGIVVLMLPSILATGTDPLTARAVFVIALALAFILIGAIRRLAAPFILGLIALPIENVVVFAVHIGRDIGALPWWITLATAGAVLLILAVTSERREAGSAGVRTRMRDLR